MFYFISNQFNDNALFGGIIQPCSILPNDEVCRKGKQGFPMKLFFRGNERFGSKTKNRGTLSVEKWSTKLWYQTSS